jgi:tRNA-2-methylthio-N6-dimethylallyladenosine synthase
MADNVPADEKLRRLKALDALQERVSSEINERLVGATQQVLVENRHKGKWRGRTPTNKLVFFEDDAERTGQLVEVTITSSSAWSMQGAVNENGSGRNGGVVNENGSGRNERNEARAREIIPLSQ